MSSSTGLGGGVGGSETSTSTSRLLCDFRGWEEDEADGRGRDRFRARLALREDFFGGRGGGGGKRWTQRRLSRRVRLSPRFHASPCSPRSSKVISNHRLTVKEKVGVASLVPPNRLHPL
jgi:hypothetical protein